MSDGKGSVARNAAGVAPGVVGRGGHRWVRRALRQITLDCLDSASGKVFRGRT